VTHYDTARPHRGLNLATPIAHPRQEALECGSLRCSEILGGIIHEYEWAAGAKPVVGHDAGQLVPARDFLSRTTSARAIC
jgi:hypothetical protein